MFYTPASIVKTIVAVLRPFSNCRVYDRKHRDFTDEDIEKLSNTFAEFQEGKLEDVKGFCAVADLAAIAKQDYILTPGRYVGIEEQEDDGEPFDEKNTVTWRRSAGSAEEESRCV